MKGRVLTFAAIIAMLMACEREPQGELTLSQESVSFDSGGGVIELTVDANENWTCNTGASDLIFSTKKGEAGSTGMTITVPGNPTEEGRSMEVKFNCGNAKAVLTIDQGGSVFVSVSILHNAQTFTIPRFDGTKYTGTVDWGDDKNEKFSGIQKDTLIIPSHEYPNVEDHNVTIQIHDADSFTLESMGGVKKIDLTKF